MTYYDWSEEGFDWAGLEDCCNILYRTCTQFGRIGGQIKEKWGSFRFYAQFWNGSLYSLCRPGYMWNNWPAFFRWFDYKVFVPLVRSFGLVRIFQQYQYVMYRRGYRQRERKYPHLSQEIYCAADHFDVLGKRAEDFGWVTYPPEQNDTEKERKSPQDF